MTPVWHIWRLHAAEAKTCGTRRTNTRFLDVKRRVLQKQKPSERLPLGRFPFERLPLKRTVTTEAADVLAWLFCCHWCRWWRKRSPSLYITRTAIKKKKKIPSTSECTLYNITLSSTITANDNNNNNAVHLLLHYHYHHVLTTAATTAHCSLSPPHPPPVTTTTALHLSHSTHHHHQHATRTLQLQ